MRKQSPTFSEVPVNIVGSSTFGRYPKISIEKTYNMIMSDGWLVPFAGYERARTINPHGSGRGIFNSVRAKRLYVVIDDDVYSLDNNLHVHKVGEIDSFEGDVFIDENEKNEIAICDQSAIYIYNHSTNVFRKADLNFIPAYVSYQDGRFIAPVKDQPYWRLCELGSSFSWPENSSFVGSFQTKPDNVVATVRFPGRGNQLAVFGKTIIEFWTDYGLQLFPYQKNVSTNIDYGCINAATIASSDNVVCWLSSNEKSGPVISYTTGGEIRQISTDGINFLFAQLKNPENSYGFMFKQDGHLLYQISFPKDNLSLVYDFNTAKFFHVSNEALDAHIAKKVAFFNGNYYFISTVDGNLYELSSQFTTLNGKVCPRLRTPATIRLPNSMPFVLNNIIVPMEQGESGAVQSIDVALSLDGGESFGNFVNQPMNELGKRKNIFRTQINGRANEFVPLYRFWGEGRFVAGNGTASIYQ